MITFGIAKKYMYAGDGTLRIQVRIPSIHGPELKSQYRGKAIRNYVEDDDLPYYQSVLLPHKPAAGSIVAIGSLNSANSDFIVLGLTGGTTSYVYDGG